jgi:hypothetical protein
MGRADRAKDAKRARRAVATSETEETGVASVRFFLLSGGGIAILALGTTAAMSELPPWLSAIIWVLILATFSGGLGVLKFSRLVRTVVTVVVMGVVLAVWFYQAPHAATHISRVVQARDSSGIFFNVYVTNSGRAPSRYGSAHGVLVADSSGSAIREAQARVSDGVQRLDVALLDRLEPGDMKMFTVPTAIDPSDQQLYDKGNAALIVGVEVRYRDWSILRHRVAKCGAFLNGRATIDCVPIASVWEWF